MSRWERKTHRAGGREQRLRLRVGADVLAATPGSIVTRLDKAVEGAATRDVTVMLSPGVSPTSAAAELRRLADELEG
jgi:hypothetical protein